MLFLSVWLGAKICTGKTEVPIIDCVKVDGDMSFSQAPADSVATDLLCARLGLNVENLHWPSEMTHREMPT